MTETPVTVLGLVASPQGSARTALAVAAVLDGAREAGATTTQLALVEHDRAEVLQAVADADAVVFGSPVYRATYSSLLKQLLEATERGRYGEATAPLRGTAAAVVLTGATPHHYLAVDSLRSVLAGFFAAQVLSPGLYLDHSGYVDGGALTEPVRELAGSHGRALAELAAAVRTSSALRGLEPQV
ncbi:MAG: NADPH-dependent reductase [Modestobacter sp.]|jgi:FMN reductase|nr:NADPH-dependent reductase [Modestobacter sp.]